ncbi:MAG: ABC transporter permease [Flavobacteriales bacterium]
MNTELFITSRMIKGDKESGDSLSRPVIRIASLGVILGVAVMILSVAIVTGFKNNIREKVIGFGSHVKVTSFKEGNEGMNQPIRVNQPFYPHIDTLEEVRHIQQYAELPGMIETEKNIQGIVVKGIGEDFDKSFFKDKIVKGELLELSGKDESDQVNISQFIASRMRLGVGDEITVYMITGREDLNPRVFTIKGIYKTGLEKYDKKYIFTDIGHIRKVAKWGIDARVKVDENKGKNCSLKVQGLAYGKAEKFQYKWTVKEWKGPGPHNLCVQSDTSVGLIVSDNRNTIPDSVTLVVNNTKGANRTNTGCLCKEDHNYEIYADDGSGKYYTGGFEILMKDYEQMKNAGDLIRRKIGAQLSIKTIDEQNKEIFSWLELLDMNIIIILVIMIGVASINMSAALLVLILERTNMIGVLKTLGINNWGVRKVFLYNAVYIIAKGVIYGDILGIGLGLIQKYTGLIELPQKNYYISEVPINFEWDHIFLLNIGTILLCTVVLVLPSYQATKISPVSAIRFD